MLIYYDKKELVDKLFLATVDVIYLNNDFLFIFLILGLVTLDSFDCLGSKIGIFIQDMKPAVWSNSAKLP